MKKLIYCALALAAGLFATSCMQENLEPVQEGNTVTFKVSLPEVATKAFDDGREVIDDLVYAVYRTTATTEAAAFADYENYQLVYQVNPEQQTGFSNGSTTVELELINDQNYVILFWAQNFDAGVYNTTDLRNVSYATEKFNALKANEGAYAAFSGRAFIEKVKGTSVQSVTLYRPFAQINIGTADPEKYDVQVLKTAVSVSRAGAGFNVADQTALESTTTPYVVEFEAAAMPEGEKLTVGTTEYHSCVNNEGKSEEEKLNHHYVAMNYIFAKETVAVTYAIETTFGTVTNTIDNVPVKTNYRTNIIGNLLTSDVKYDVTLDKDWGTPDKNVEVISVASADEIVEAIKNASADKETNIKLEENIDLGTLSQLVNTKSSAQPTGNSVIVIPENRSIVVDLNGCKLNAPYRQNSTTNHYYAFENYGTLTIVDSKGNGAINSRGNFNYGTMILESGTIDAIDGNGGYGVRNYEGAEFVMNGGAIVTSLEDDNLVDDGGYDATTLRVDEGATATINGGTINNICDYTFAIENHGETTVNDGTFTSVHTTLANYAVMIVNGGSFTCNGLEGITAHALWAAGGTTTINGGTFDGKDNYNGFNVDASAGAEVNINGGKFLQVHSGSLYGDGTISVTGGEFFDDPSERVAEGFIAEKNGEVWVVAKAPVAQIGEVKYYTLEEAVAAAKAGDTITVLCDVTLSETLTLPAGVTFNGNGKEIQGTINVAGDLAIMGDVTISTLKAINGGEISIEDGKVLTLRNFSFGSKDNANAEYEITGGTVTANYGFFQHGTYALRSNFETGYMYYSYGSDITVYGTFHSQGKGDGLDYVRGKLTIAKGGKSIHDKSLWVGQPAGWGAMEASLTIEDGGYVEANTLCVYAGSSLTYSNNADLKYNNSTFEGTINAPQQDNEIWYTATALVHAHYYKDKFGEGTDLVSNKYDEATGKGVITLSGPVTKIGSNAFYQNVGDPCHLISITLPNTVTEIGEDAFDHCINLTTVKFSENLLTIGPGAFGGCEKLTNVTLPEGLITIGDNAFDSCSAMTSVVIPSTVTSIGMAAFISGNQDEKKIYCKPTIPPTVGYKPFNIWYAEIYVPTASLAAYQEEWGSIADNIYDGNF